MKRALIILSFAAAFAACGGADQKPAIDSKAKLKDSANFTTIKWIDSLKDIGTVEAGKKAEIKFRFSNTGDKALYIIKAEPGCGCTVADYPKEPIMPGKEGIITANYNVATDGTGEFRKNIKVVTNTAKTDDYIFFYGKIKNDKVVQPQEKNSSH